MSGLQQIHQSVVGDALKAGFQNFVDQSATRIATAVAGTPAAGYFYSLYDTSTKGWYWYDIS
jgi:hypothetical protein